MKYTTDTKEGKNMYQLTNQDTQKLKNCIKNVIGCGPNILYIHVNNSGDIGFCVFSDYNYYFRDSKLCIKLPLGNGTYEIDDIDEGDSIYVPYMYEAICTVFDMLDGINLFDVDVDYITECYHSVLQSLYENN